MCYWYSFAFIYPYLALQMGLMLCPPISRNWSKTENLYNHYEELPAEIFTSTAFAPIKLIQTPGVVINYFSLFNNVDFYTCGTLLMLKKLIKRFEDFQKTKVIKHKQKMDFFLKFLAY